MQHLTSINHMVVYSTFQFCLLLRPGKEMNTVYSTKLISPETLKLDLSEASNVLPTIESPSD